MQPASRPCFNIADNPEIQTYRSKRKAPWILTEQFTLGFLPVMILMVALFWLTIVISNLSKPNKLAGFQSTSFLMLTALLVTLVAMIVIGVKRGMKDDLIYFEAKKPLIEKLEDWIESNYKVTFMDSSIVAHRLLVSDQYFDFTVRLSDEKLDLVFEVPLKFSKSEPLIFELDSKYLDSRRASILNELQAS